MEGFKLNDKDVIVHFFQRLAEYPCLKIALGIIVWFFRMLFGPFRAAYGVVFLLYFADWVTGIYCARSTPGVKIESRRLFHGLVKLAIYFTLLFIGYQCGKIELFSYIQAFIETFIILTESYSILENLEKIALLKGINIPLLKPVMKLVQGKIGEIENEKEN
jgi:phage-related holin